MAPTAAGAGFALRKGEEKDAGADASAAPGSQH